MKATMLLITGTEAENFGRKLMLLAYKAGNMGFEMARLPPHVSLKRPFAIKSLEQLDEVQKRLFRELEERFGPSPALHDNDYVFHMTVSIGGAPFEKYQKAYEILKKEDVRKEFCFNKLGLLYYDDDNLGSRTYFCYKVVNIIPVSTKWTA